MQGKILVLLLCVCSLAAPQSSSSKRREQKLRKELSTPYDDWLNKDVAYIITDQERQAFKRLSNDEERDQFVEQFWLRRDPTPDTEENEYKEEHYRRLAYANEHFASGIPGWKTDRGRMYIRYGAPDEIEPHPAGGSYQRPIEEGGGQITAYPFEIWRYRHIEGIDTNIQIEFVDPTRTGEYHLSIDPTEKNALLHVLGPDRSVNGALPGAPPINPFDLLEKLALLEHPPAIQYKDLQEAVTSNIRYTSLPMLVRTDFIPLTSTAILSSITVQFERKDLQFEEKDGVSRSIVHFYARLSTMSRRRVNEFEDALRIDGSADPAAGAAIAQKTVPLAPGRYRLTIVAKDIIGGNTGTYETAIDVPEFPAGRLGASSLILADLLERVPPRNAGAGQFVIADTKVRPRMTGIFQRRENLGIYLQLYNVTPRSTVEYSVRNNTTGESMFELLEDAGAASSQATIQKLIPLHGFAPGPYTLRLRITDPLSGQAITPQAEFRVVDR